MTTPKSDRVASNNTSGKGQMKQGGDKQGQMGGKPHHDAGDKFKDDGGPKSGQSAHVSQASQR